MASSSSNTNFTTPTRTGTRVDGNVNAATNGRSPLQQVSFSSFRLPATPDSHQVRTQNERQVYRPPASGTGSDNVSRGAHDRTWVLAGSSFDDQLPGGTQGPPDSFDPSRNSGASRGSSSTQRALRAISPATAQDLESRSRQMVTILTSTPRNKHSTRDNAAGQSLATHAQSVVRSLGGVPIASDGWLLQLLIDCKVPGDHTVAKWVHTTAKPVARTKVKKGAKAKKGESHAHYANVRWTSIPMASPDLKERDLYKPFVSLINSILTKFNVRGREVTDNHAKYLRHQEEEHRTAPDLVVCAVGSSFETPSSSDTVGYSNMVTFIDVKLDDQLNKEVHKEQLVVYVRQIFAHQPNRWFVRCLLLSENRIRIYQFDRAGGQTTELYDIHTEPELFFRIILLVCTDKDDRHLGLDDTFRWEMDDEGRKEKGFVKTLAPDRAKELVLLDVDPVAHHRHIRGCATALWEAYDPDTMIEYLIKDSWSSEGRTPEWMLLQRAAEEGVKGVCRMAWYEECRMSTDSIRCEETTALFFNRIQFRIVVERYGLEIHNFTSVLQVVEALRDAIVAHMALHKIGILHRDISNKTILLGREGASAGWRGVLIDLGLAFDLELEADSAINKEPIMGSYFFQSSGILEWLTELNEDKLPPAHDYLDDLESFFCVLCYLLFLFLPDGTPREPTDKARIVVKGWDSDKADEALPPKAMLFHPSRSQKRFAANQISKSWGKACRILFEEYHEWVCKAQAEKARLADEYREKRADGVEEGDEESTAEDYQGSIAPSDLSVPSSPSASVDVYPDTESSGSPDSHYESIFAPLLKQSPTHYDDVLYFFKKAIIALGGTNPEPEHVLEIPLVPGGTNGKRRLSFAREGPAKSSKLEGGRSSRAEHTA